MKQIRLASMRRRIKCIPWHSAKALLKQLWMPAFVCSVSLHSLAFCQGLIEAKVAGAGLKAIGLHSLAFCQGLIEAWFKKVVIDGGIASIPWHSAKALLKP